MRFAVSVGDQLRTVEVDDSGVRIDGREVQVDVAKVGVSRSYAVVLAGASFHIVADRAGKGQWSVQSHGHQVSVEVLDERAAKIRELTARTGGAGKARALKAPMPGMVVKVEVAEGDAVEVGQGLVIVEAMKMENELKAQAAGRVSRVLAEAGQAVDKDQVLIEFADEVES